MSNQIEHWRVLIAVTAVSSCGAGTFMEMFMDKSHSLPWAAIGCALFGLTGAFTILFFDKFIAVSWMGHAIPGWIAGPSVLFIGGWLFDYRHGYVMNHQAANYTAFAVGVGIALIKLGLESKLKFEIPFTPSATAPHAEPVKPRIKTVRKRTTTDLPGLIRELALALNNNFDMTERQKKFVEDNLLAAVNGLIQVKRIDKAAQLCRKVPSNWIRFENCLEGLDLDDGLRLAMASFKIDDWGTALRLFDWALKSHPSPSLERRVFHTAEVLADQVRVLDDAFEAKVIALQLSPRLTQTLKKVIRTSA